MMVDVPKFDELMWPTLKAMKALGGSATVDEILEKVVELESYPEEIQNAQHSTKANLTKLAYRLAWARTYLKYIDAITNSARGVWATTDVGEKLKESDLPPLVKKFKDEYNKKKKKPKNDGAPDDEDTTYDWRESLIEIILEMKPDAFERLAQRILRESGFKTVKVSGKTGDGGIDGTGILQVNLITFPVAFQCKRYSGSVGAPIVRDFRGAIMGKCEKGLLITTGNFTAEAQKEASRDGALAIDLVDGQRLCELLKELSLGVKIEMIEDIKINGAWFESI